MNADLSIRYYTDDLIVEVTQRLVDAGLLTSDKLGEIQGRAALTLQGVDSLLIQEAIVNETDLLKAFADVSGIPFHNIGDFKIEQAAIDRAALKSPCATASSPSRSRTASSCSPPAGCRT